MRVHQDWELTPQGVALHLPTATAVIADVHLGYAQARRRRGEAVPLVSVEEYFLPLAPVLAEHAVRRLAVAGDLFEEKADPDLLQELMEWLQQVRLDWFGLVPGNHDRGFQNIPARSASAGIVSTIPALALRAGEEENTSQRAIPELSLFPEGISLGDWLVLHGDQPLPRGRVVHGHLHPCFRLNQKITAPCFLVSPDRIILPAFSPDAAGASVLNEPLWGNYRCLVCTGNKLLDFGKVQQWQKSGQAFG